MFEREQTVVGKTVFGKVRYMSHDRPSKQLLSVERVACQQQGLIERVLFSRASTNSWVLVEDQ